MKVVRVRVPVSRDPADVAGASVGLLHRRAIDDVLRAESQDPRLLLLDFAPVRSATASYLKAFWLPVVRAGERWMEGQTSAAGEGEPPADVYPVLTNLTDDVREEFAVLAKAEGVCAIEARHPRESELGAVHVHGVLEPSVRETILALSTHGPASAAALHAAQGSARVATAWNNRLNELCRLRLATRRKAGRQMVYELIAREVMYG